MTTTTATSEARRDSVFVSVRDTVLVTAPDSASLWALVECDEAGRARLAELRAEQGRRAALEAALDSAGRLTVRARVDTVRQVVTRHRTYVARSADSSSAERVEAAGPRGSRLRDALAALGLFMLGVAAGCVLRSLRG